MSAPEDIPIDPAAMIRIGTVASIDLAAARCTVLYSTDESQAVESPPLRWLMARAGDTGVWSPPRVGEQGVLLCPWGDIAMGVFLPGLTRDTFPPVGDGAEQVLQFPDGARFAYDPESQYLTVNLPAGSTVDLVADDVRIQGSVTIDGPLSVSGNVAVTGTLTAEDDVVGGGKSLKSHKHTGVTTGGGVSGAPQ